MAKNGTLLQSFHWYTNGDGTFWKDIANQAAALANLGLTALWLPPAFKGAGGTFDVGYGIYDLYDLGEFNQKGTVRTKYGIKDEYLQAIKSLHDAGIQAYADVVFNQKGGADATEWVRAVEVADNNRNFAITDERWIRAWTVFNFPGRGEAYSSFKWNWDEFDGVDWDDFRRQKAIYKFTGRGKDWSKMVSDENGNYDYLMYSDLDMNDENVRTELSRWGEWFVGFTGIDGFRLDAVKHIQYSFFRDWLGYLREITGKPLFTVGEYWEPYNIQDLHTYIEATEGTLSLFDAPLHRNFYEASHAGGNYDMRTILNNTLMQQQPALAVTLVDNHDTQPLQALESWVDYWFRPLAYAIILLRAEGYPTVFAPDLDGVSYSDKGQDGQTHQVVLAPVPGLRDLLAARRDLAYGVQRDWFDHWDVIGWTREGDDDHPGSGLAVLMSDGPGGSKWMQVGNRHAGETFVDLLGHSQGTVTINSDGWGEFRTEGGSVSVWAKKK
jgi:alpha-amylase